MANGWRYLVLAAGVDYDGLPAYAEGLAAALEGALEQGVDGPGVRLRGVIVGGHSYWVAYEDWFDEFTLEPRTAAAEAHLDAVLEQLKRSGYSHGPSR